jgi:sulfite exporter TauE/SafE
MQSSALPAILAAGFMLGLLHALDADHIVAVSSLASRQRRWQNGAAYAARWALGHGAILLLVALAALFFGLHLDQTIGHIAEQAVGVILIISGLAIIRQLHRQRIGLAVHRHGAQLHAHLAAPAHGKHHDHTPVLVGLVHGLAGSAPALALIPAALFHPALAAGYVLIFSLGALCGMVLFGLLLGRCQQFLLRHSPRIFDGSRLALGLGATGLGLFWLGAA